MKKSNRWIRAGLQAAGAWAAIVAVALVLESLFNSSGPEYAAPIPAILICAVLLGWIPALFVFLSKLRKG